MPEDAAGVGLVAEVQGMPVPVRGADRAARQAAVGGQPPLPVVGGKVVRRPADADRVHLGDEKVAMARASRKVTAQEYLLGPVRPGGVVVGRRQRGRRVEQPVLGAVWHVLGGRDTVDLAAAGEGAAVAADQVVRDELVGPEVLAHHRGLPGQVLGAESGLEPAPGQVVRRVRVARLHGPRVPELGPVGEPVGPVVEAPRVADRVDRAVLQAQVRDEGSEDVVVVEVQQSDLIVHLDTDDRGVVGILRHESPDHSFREEPEGRVGEVRVLPAAEPERRPLGGNRHDLWVGLGQPWRDRVGRCGEHHGDTGGVQGIENPLQPAELEPSLLGLAQGPDRVPDARVSGCRRPAGRTADIRSSRTIRSTSASPSSGWTG